MRNKKTIKKALLCMSIHETVEYCHGLESNLERATRSLADIKVNAHPDDRMTLNIISEWNKFLESGNA